MYNTITSYENLFNAWIEFVPGKRLREDVAFFGMFLHKNIFNLHISLSERIYRHGPYTHFKINDPKPRDIHKASVRDRLVHHALYKILYPYFDKQFIFDSYSCRKDKGAHRAMKRFQLFISKVSRNNTRQCYILKCDVKKFFASIDQEKLISILNNKGLDKEVVHLLSNIIKSFPAGLPLGNLTSQLLVNVYMNEFDQYIKHVLKVKYYIRYSDDFVVLSNDKLYLEKLLPKIGEYLQNTLLLSLHPDKVFIKTISSGVDFLGWVHFPNHRVLRTSTKHRMKRRLLISEKEETKTSYRGLLSHGNSYKVQKQVGLL